MDERAEFLRTWYQILWSNIDRSMKSIWQIVGTIGLVGAAFLYMDKLGPNLTASLQLVIAFWALNNTMDMNAWHRRNLIFAARVERQFLKPTDYGAVIPSSFREPRTDWIEFYSINFATFGMLIGIVMWVYVARLSRTLPLTCRVAGPALVFLVGLIATWCTYRRCEDQVSRYLYQTQGSISQS